MIYNHIHVPVNINWVRLLFKRNQMTSFWEKVELGPPDPIYGLKEAYLLSKSPKKVNLSIGTYQDDNGKPHVFPCVRKAEKYICDEMLSKAYSPVVGDEEFCKYSVELALGNDSTHLKDGLVAYAQGLSRTGCTRVLFEFLKRHYPGDKTVHFSMPTWGNHWHVANQVSLAIRYYQYYDPATCGLNYKGLMDDVAKMPDTSIIVLQGCAHNPTGIDPTRSQWDEISHLTKHKKLLVFFEMGHHGFASGDFEMDAYPVRKFLKDNNRVAIVQSYGKNMGLYSDRVGCMSLITETPADTKRVLSQLKVVIRGMYSNPPIHGARIVKKILSDPGMRAEWYKDFKNISHRITTIRKMLKSKLLKEGSIRNWDHIVNQNGMFCFTGLNKTQVVKLIKEHSIFLSTTGRISMGGLNRKNVDYVAHAMHLVTRFK